MTNSVPYFRLSKGVFESAVVVLAGESSHEQCVVTVELNPRYSDDRWFPNYRLILLKQLPNRLRGSFINGVDCNGAKAIWLIELAIVKTRTAPKLRTNHYGMPLP